MLQVTKAKIARRVAIVRACRITGSVSRKMKRILFSSYVYPLFAWLFGIFPLLTDRQRDELSHYYLVCLKICLGLSFWNDVYFSAAFNEKSLENLCYSYWKRYRTALYRTTDGLLLYERLVHEWYRDRWLAHELIVSHIHRSKRIVKHTSTLTSVNTWFERNEENSVPFVPQEDLETLINSALSFLTSERNDTGINSQSHRIPPTVVNTSPSFDSSHSLTSSVVEVFCFVLIGYSLLFLVCCMLYSLSLTLTTSDDQVKPGNSPVLILNTHWS